MPRLRTYLLSTFVLVIFCTTNTALGDDTGVDPEVGNAIKQAYAGDLKRCEKELDQLTTRGAQDPLVLWNLAVVRVRQDRLGRALHSMMLLLDQNAPRTLKRRTLKLKAEVISRLVERARREGDPNLFALHDPRSLLDRWLGLFPPDIWRWAGYLLFWLAALGWLARSYGPMATRAIATGFAVLFFLSSALAASSDLLARHEGESARLAVTVEKQTLLKEGLVDGAPTRNLPEGVVLEVLDQVTENLVVVRLADGREGFMALTDLAVVE